MGLVGQLRDARRRLERRQWPVGANGGNDLISGTTVIASTAVDQIFGTVGSDDDWYLVTSNDVLENVEQNEVTSIN